MPSPLPKYSIVLLTVVVVLMALVGILRVPTANSPENSVVVYSALDEQFSRPIFDLFTQSTGITVLAKYDTESTKTVGLTQAIFAERERPRCDVFWNNEIVNTLRLDRAGLLARYDPPAAANFPAEFQSTDHRWHGFAARARVLLVNTEKLVAEEFPQSILDLADPRWKGHCAIAKPLAGTTASHAACLFAAWGAERAEEFFRGVKANCQVLSGNKQVARAVATGEVAFGLTDTDDAMGEIDAGRPVAIVYPDQGPEQMGALFIPNTVSLVANHPHAEAARRLVDFLLSPVVEQRLAAGPSVQIPLSSLVDQRPRVETPRTIRAMQVDFAAAAESWNHAAEFLRDEFATAE